MSSDIVKDLEQAYECGELEELKESILPFIRTNREKLMQFIDEFQKIEGPCSLDLLIKVFIIQHNMPFNMRSYMTRQSDLIQKEITPGADLTDRQKQVSEWIRKKAGDHRSISMFQQVYCFEKLKDQLIPLIHRELYQSESSEPFIRSGI